MLDVEYVVGPSAEQNGSQPASIGTASMGQSTHSSRSSSFVNIDQTGIPSDQNGLQSASPSEVHSLRQSLAEKEHHLNSTLTKLQALHGHYAELHQAYADLRDKQPDNNEYSQQIGQLQTALAIAVGEKTQMQTELRGAHSHQKVLESEIDFLRSQAKGTITNNQLMSQQAENQKLTETIANQSATIAQQRKELSELEAKIVVSNQDKNDIQARLKFVYQEKDEIVARLNELKNELSIKEIYIRQLAKHTSADSTQGQQTIQTLTEQKNLFEAECQRYIKDFGALKNEFDGLKRHYDECLSQSKDHSTTLEQTIEQLTNQKRQLEFSKFCLEEELQLLRKSAQDNLAVSQMEKVEDPVTDNPESNTNFDYQALHNSYQRMEVEFQRQTILIGQLNSALEEKDSLNIKLNHQIEESGHKINRLESQIQHLQQIGSDVSQLSTQLQNERATVSRAVSQNMELKEQFGELQDKLIKITNEAAQIEDQKVNALALVAKLSRKIEDVESSQPKPEANEISVQTDNIEIPIENPIETPAQNEQNSLNYSHIANVHYPEELHEKSPENSPEIIQNESTSTQNTSYEESSSATPETIDLSALQEENSDSNEDTVRDFFNNPKSSDSNFTRNLRNTFYNLQENANKLKERVESLEKLNDEYKQANDRLQYWLTSVESENESIADFIELYRTQRAQMKTKMEEKENECNELRKTRELLESRLKLLQSSLLGFLKKNQKISEIEDAKVNEDENFEKPPPNNCDIHELMRILTQISHEESHLEENRLQQLAQTLQNSSMTFDPKLHCSECRGELYDL